MMTRGIVMFPIEHRRKNIEPGRYAKKPLSKAHPGFRGAGSGVRRPVRRLTRQEEPFPSCVYCGRTERMRCGMDNVANQRPWAALVGKGGVHLPSA
jgi:hypothetical protein